MNNVEQGSLSANVPGPQNEKKKKQIFGVGIARRGNSVPPAESAE